MTITFKDKNSATSAVFPPKMLEMQIPGVVFSPIARRRAGTFETIMFPIPPNLTFTDNATYNNVELGLGKHIADGRDGLDKIIGGLTSEDSGRKSILSAIRSTGLIPDSPAIQALDIKEKKIFNPNIATAFAGMTPRTFAFTFKMVAENKDESELIKVIIDSFRKNTYAAVSGKDAIFLDYPPTWNIQFVKFGEPSKEKLLRRLGRDLLKSKINSGPLAVNEYFPKILPCYLSEVTTTYNESGSVFHSDDTPVEVMLTLTFTETTAPTAGNI